MPRNSCSRRDRRPWRVRISSSMITTEGTSVRPACDYREARGLESIVRNRNRLVRTFLQNRDSGDLVVDGIAHHVGRGLEIEFVEHAPLVRADGFDAQVEFGGDFTDALTGHTGHEDVALAGGKDGVD